MALTFKEKVKLEKNNLIMIYRGRDGLGQDMFAYVKCDRKGVEKMRDDYENKVSVSDLNTYGEMIYKDNVKDPDDKAKAFLRGWLEENGGSEIDE